MQVDEKTLLKLKAKFERLGTFDPESRTEGLIENFSASITENTYKAAAIELGFVIETNEVMSD